MPQLGKRPPPSLSLRLNLDPKAHLQLSQSQVVSSLSSDEEGESSRKRIKIPILQSSNGCLSPTDSPKYLEESLRKAAEIQRKQKEKEEEEGQIGRFCLLSPLDNTGFTYHALDTKTQQLKTCQVLSRKQYDHLIQVSERLNSSLSSKTWPYDDTKDMIEKIVPSNVDLIKHRDGKHYFFAEKNSGSLHGYVQTRKKLSEAEARMFYAQIVRIVAFCHSRGIVVRDLKLRKFVFADETRTVLKLGSVSDLVVCADNSDELTDRHGCPAYVSPEILDLHQKSYSGKLADVWSLGVLLFVMIVGRYPFYASTPAGLFGKIRQGTFQIPPEEGISDEAGLLLRGLLRREAKNRPSALTLLNLPWLTRNGSDCVLRQYCTEIMDGQKQKKLGKFVENDDQVVPCIVTEK